MPKLKHDFLKLKLKFFTSDFNSVSRFLESKGFNRGFSGGFGGHIEKNTQGWAKEKKQLEQRIYEKSLREYQDERAIQWKHAFEILDKARLKQLNEFTTLLIKGSVSSGKFTLNKFDPNKMRVVKYLIDILNHINGIMGIPSQIKVEPNNKEQGLSKEDIEALKGLNLA